MPGDESHEIANCKASVSTFDPKWSYIRIPSKSFTIDRSRWSCFGSSDGTCWDGFTAWLRSRMLPRLDSEEERLYFEKTVAFLRSVPLFKRQLPSCELPKLARDLKRKTWRPGDKLVNQGEVGRAFYLVESGVASVIVADEDGKEHVRATLIAGDYFGGHTLVAERPNVGTVVAQGPEQLVTLSMSRRVFEDSGLKDKLCFPKRPALYFDRGQPRDHSFDALVSCQLDQHEQALVLEALKNNVNLRALHKVDNEVMQSIARGAVRRFVPKGTVVAQSGTLGKEFFIIKTGRFHAVAETDTSDGQKSAEATVAQLTMSERLKRKQTFLKSLCRHKGSNPLFNHSQSVRVPGPRGPKAMADWADELNNMSGQRGPSSGASTLTMTSPCSETTRSSSLVPGTPLSTVPSMKDFGTAANFQVGDKVTMLPDEEPADDRDDPVGTVMDSGRDGAGRSWVKVAFDARDMSGEWVAGGTQHTLVAAALAVFAASALTFVAPQAPPARGTLSGVQMQAGGEYTGFVPDLQRRQLMNFVLVTTAAIPVLVALGCYLWYFVPPVAGGGSGATLAGDQDGNPITLDSWVKSHKENDRELVLGLKGEPFYLISTADNIKDFALLSVCTHLGCVVPWNKGANKFCCPCHGSQYDENGKVVRGPAPLSLALAHTTTTEGKIALTPWPEKDFRTDLDPWWKV
ncbi:petC [Symbiodinium natans]|uniref:plastoquinol--plastocyanin reductase n=1 Tax=Symbiodinium natans TaxID=878477 RepID=A0A812IZX3_9DINO|nr:petC [Symbiodinium natans]